MLYYIVFNLLYSIALSLANFRPSHFSTIMSARNIGKHMSTCYNYPKVHRKFVKHFRFGILVKNWVSSMGLWRLWDIDRLYIQYYTDNIIYALNHSQHNLGILPWYWIGMLAPVIIGRPWSCTGDQRYAWTNLESQTISWQTNTQIEFLLIRMAQMMNDEWTQMNVSDKNEYT